VHIMRQRIRNQHLENEGSQTEKVAAIKPKRRGGALRNCLIFVGLISFLAMANRVLLYQEAQILLNPGVPVLVGEYNLTLYCEGSEDSKNVVFIVPGANVPYLPYTALLKWIGKEGSRACVYDRPQRLFSSGQLNRGIQSWTGDLHKLITVAKGNRSNVVLAGHSLGGLISTVYSVTYPNDVGGLVLLDSCPTSYERSEMFTIGVGVAATFHSLRLFAFLGLNRLASVFRPKNMWYFDISPEHHRVLDFYWNEYSNHVIHEADGVVEEMTQYLRKKGENKEHLLDVPVRLVMAEKFGLFGLDGAWDTLWKHELILGNLSAKTSTITIPRSDHSLPLLLPQETAKEIQFVCNLLTPVQVHS